jgi:hypothetical protein
MRIVSEGLKLAVHCKCGRRMVFNIHEGFTCFARTRWNFFLHDKPATYAEARKLVDKKQTS